MKKYRIIDVVWQKENIFDRGREDNKVKTGREREREKPRTREKETERWESRMTEVRKKECK